MSESSGGRVQIATPRRSFNPAAHTQERDPSRQKISTLRRRDAFILKFYLDSVPSFLRALYALDESLKPQGYGAGGNGIQVMANERRVALGGIHSSLGKIRFNLYDLYRRPWQDAGMEITLTYVREGSGLQLPGEVRTALSSLHQGTWKHAHAWENPDSDGSLSLILLRHVDKVPHSTIFFSWEGLHITPDLRRATK